MVAMETTHHVATDPAVAESYMNNARGNDLGKE